MPSISAAVRMVLILLFAGSITLWPGLLRAQGAAPATVATLPDPLTRDAIDAMVSRLSDADVRALLLQELDARAKPAGEAAPPLVDVLATPIKRVADNLQLAATTAPDHARAALAALSGYVGSLGPGGGLHLGLVLIAALAAGFAIDLLIGRWISRNDTARGMSISDIPAFPASIPYLSRWLLGDLVGAVLSLVLASVFFVLLLPERETRVAISVALWLFFFPRIGWIVLRFFLSPNAPDLRLVATDQRTAEILFRGLMGLTMIVGLIQTLRLLMRETGAGASAQAFGFWINLAAFLWLAVIVVRCRSGLKRIVQGGDTSISPEVKWIAAGFPAYALIAIAGTWVAATVSGALDGRDVLLDGRHYLSLGILLVTPMCDALIRATVRLVVPPMQGSGSAAQAAFDAVWRSFVRIGRVVVYGTLVVVLAKLWGMSLVGLASAGVGEHLAERTVVATLILMVGYILIELVSLLVNRKLANLHSDAISSGPVIDDDLGPISGGPSSRAGTILPPISWTLQGAIMVITLVTALGQLGVNVTALLAGAGVAGIAIGFGAQKLVADLVSGIFFLMDDAFRINEYIAAGAIEGGVEKIALQSMHLRGSDGAIHCVPYSSVKQITNYSRDWGTAKLVFTVPFDTDIEKVRKIFKKIGQDIATNPEFADAILQPFKFKGVRQVTDLGIVVGGKFMFRPESGKQFVVKRDIYRRVQEDFAAAGITFARREVHVSVNAGDETPAGATLDAISGAASMAALTPKPQT